MNLNWLWQGLLTNWLAATGIFCLGVLLVYLKAKAPRLSSLILYGLGVCTLLTVILCAFRVIATLPQEIPEITPKNIETNIRTWLDRFELGTRRTTNADSYFMYEVKLKNNAVVVISRSKNIDNYINFGANLEITKEIKTIMNNLKNEQVEHLVHEIILEMARYKIESMIVLPLNNVLLHRRVPITNNLTEDTFIERINEVGFALNIANETIVLGLDRLAKENTTPSLR